MGISEQRFLEDKISEFFGNTVTLPTDIGIEFLRRNGDIPTEIMFFIKHPNADMQENCNCFESWCLAIYAALDGAVKIRIAWYNQEDEPRCQYNRFIYRLAKFHELYDDWIIINGIMSEYDELMAKNLYLTTSEDLSIPHDDTGIIAHEHKLEQLLKRDPLFQRAAGLTFIDNQLATCVYDKATEKIVLGTEYSTINLFGMPPYHEYIAVFELKIPDNTKPSVISELFFYANLLEDILADRIHILETHPLYKSILELRQSQAYIRAVFLVHNAHPIVSPSTLDLLNKGRIKYQIINYDYTFDPVFSFS